MRYGPVNEKARNGQKIVLRNAEVSDAPVLIGFLKAVTAETPYLIREPDEVSESLAEEQAFLQQKTDSDRELLLLAFADGQHIGNCALMRAGELRRCAHRCAVAIALRQEYCGMGIGRIMLETVLRIAKETGYAQAELEVMAGNQPAIRLYESLGFQRYGVFPRNTKYSDGTYDDAYWMMKEL